MKSSEMPSAPPRAELLQEGLLGDYWAPQPSRCMSSPSSGVEEDLEQSCSDDDESLDESGDANDADYELDEISKKLEEKGKELEAMKDGRPIPRGKVRKTEEQRKIRHKLRHEEEERKQKEWKARFLKLWRWNQKKKSSPQEPTVYRPYFIIVISIVDIICLIALIAVNDGFESLKQNPMIGPSAETLLDSGAKYGPYMKDGEVYRFFSPIFLHVGIIHLLFNLIATLQLMGLEKKYGCHKIVPLYFLSGIMGNLVSVIFLPNQIMVGASGALFGLIGALGVDLIDNWKRIQWAPFHLTVYVLTVVLSLAFGLLPGIDNFCHIGGFIEGIISGIIILPNICTRRPPSRRRWILAVSCIPINLVLFFVGFLVFYVGVDVTGWCGFCAYIDCIPVYDWCDAFKS